MVQLVFLIVVIVGAWLLYRRFLRDAQRLSARSRQEERERQTGAMGTLVKDPATGEYRVRREDE